MKQLSYNKSIRFSSTQLETFKILESYGVNISQFVRQATKEKIKRDWKSIKEKKIKESNKTPWD